jgi:hypothetical protein
MRPNVMFAVTVIAAALTVVAQSSSAAAEGSIYRVDVTADWTMTVTDPTGSLDARSTGRLDTRPGRRLGGTRRATRST